MVFREITLYSVALRLLAAVVIAGILGYIAINMSKKLQKAAA